MNARTFNFWKNHRRALYEAHSKYSTSEWLSYIRQLMEQIKSWLSSPNIDGLWVRETTTNGQFLYANLSYMSNSLEIEDTGNYVSKRSNNYIKIAEYYDPYFTFLKLKISMRNIDNFYFVLYLINDEWHISSRGLPLEITIKEEKLTEEIFFKALSWFYDETLIITK